ncbi:hypothetical protein SDC9_122051 [bioreactor metagenome]|uniref:Uncharacterized protein n=1 Tax=bioreactor metagenome TaxID=1076179 RepID=A0A645CDR1_9ZZZZ
MNSINCTNSSVDNFNNGLSLALPFGKTVNSRQCLTSNETSIDFNLWRSLMFFLFTHVTTSYFNPGVPATREMAFSALSHDPFLPRNHSCDSSVYPSRLTVTERSPAWRSASSRSCDNPHPLVTNPHGYPMLYISLPVSSRSFRTSGSPPVMTTIVLCGFTCGRISDSIFRKSSLGMSGTMFSLVQSLPQCTQLKLQRNVHSQNK